jgi:aryl-alcohol dehydrogenase-like predicted oxidoreductase
MGTVQFGTAYGVANKSGQVSRSAAQEILQYAYHAGFDTLDTAISYGASERVLGSVGVKNWMVVSKLPAIPNDCGDLTAWVNGQVQQSLNDLKVDKLYGLLLHQPNQLLQIMGPKLFDILQELKARKIVDKVGVSVSGISELEVLVQKYSFDLVQAPLNILDRRLVESGWSGKLKEAGIEVHIRSVFLQGLLLMPSQLRPAVFDRWSKIWLEWDQWLISTGLTPLQACLRYVISIPTVDRVVVGVESLNQLKQILQASTGGLKTLPIFGELEDSRIINPATWKNIEA